MISAIPAYPDFPRPAAYVLEGFYLSLDLVQKQAFVQTASGDSLDLLAVLPVSPASRLPPL